MPTKPQIVVEVSVEIGNNNAAARALFARLAQISQQVKALPKTYPALEQSSQPREVQR